VLRRIEVERIEAVLAAGEFGEREVAVLCHVSRQTVRTIRHGRHHHQRRPGPGLDLDAEIKTKRSIASRETKTGRCPICGASAELPCRVCEVRQASAAKLANRRAKRLPPPPENCSDDLSPVLSGEARKRYRRLRDLKQRLAGEGDVERSRRYFERMVQLRLFEGDPPPWELDDEEAA
jgi:hypothetical protein